MKTYMHLYYSQVCWKSVHNMYISYWVYYISLALTVAFWFTVPSHISIFYETQVNVNSRSAASEVELLDIIIIMIMKAIHLRVWTSKLSG
jgi:hypothetical protein